MIDQYLNKIHKSDTLEFVKQLPDSSIDSVITSPPYYQLRDYGFTGQWGLEKTYQEYLDKLIALMSELKRVLKPTGTMWINLGDTYNTISGNMKAKEYKPTKNVCMNNGVIDRDVYTKPKDIPNKSLCLIPHRFAIRCIDELGLILRNDVIWAKRNGMPESVTDRFSKKHEFIFFFVKQQKYYFDLDSVKDEHKTKLPVVSKINKSNKESEYTKDGYGSIGYSENGKNPGDVSDFWDVPTQPSSDKHYATYNFDLIDKPIMAGCPESGIILDPFCGTGTTLIRAIQLHRSGIGIDGNEEYCKIAQKRISDELAQQDLFREVI